MSRGAPAAHCKTPTLGPPGTQIPSLKLLVMRAGVKLLLIYNRYYVYNICTCIVYIYVARARAKHSQYSTIYWSTARAR